MSVKITAGINMTIVVTTRAGGGAPARVAARQCAATLLAELGLVPHSGGGGNTGM